VASPPVGTYLKNAGVQKGVNASICQPLAYMAKASSHAPSRFSNAARPTPVHEIISSDGFTPSFGV
jgi:hypothetical protein